MMTLSFEIAKIFWLEPISLTNLRVHSEYKYVHYVQSTQPTSAALIKINGEKGKYVQYIYRMYIVSTVRSSLTYYLQKLLAIRKCIKVGKPRFLCIYLAHIWTCNGSHYHNT